MLDELQTGLVVKIVQATATASLSVKSLTNGLLWSNNFPGHTSDSVCPVIIIIIIIIIIITQSY